MRNPALLSIVAQLDNRPPLQVKDQRLLVVYGPNTDQATVRDQKLMVVFGPVQSEVTTRDQKLFVVYDDPSEVQTLIGFEGSDSDTSDTNDGTGSAPTFTGSADLTTDVTPPFGTTSLDVTTSGTVTLPLSHGQFGAEDFTIEVFARSSAFHATWYHSILGNYNGAVSYSWSLFVQNDPSNVARFLVDNDGLLLQGTTDLVLDTWYHFAISRNGTTIRLFVDGVMEAKVTNFTAALNPASGNLVVGGNNAGSNDLWNGYIKELRITKNLGRYNSDSSFTVPTSEYPR